MDHTEKVNRLIIPPAAAQEIVARAGHIYLRICPCRAEVQACSKDKWEICMLFENAPEQDRLEGKLIQTDEALKLIKMTIERGDIHQVFYTDEGQRLHELCNCCTCCCGPLRAEKHKDNHFQEQLK